MAQRSIMWFRRDLRLNDNPALATAADHGEVLPLFIIDPALWERAGDVRRTYLVRSLASLDESMGGALHIAYGAPTDVLTDLTKRFDISMINAAADFAPYGRTRDGEVDQSGLPINWVGSPYAVAPGRVRKPDGTPYRVYTPFYKAWFALGWRPPISTPKVTYLEPSEEFRRFPDASIPDHLEMPEVGEAAALKQWAWFKKSALSGYDEARNMAGVEGTSSLSAALRWGEIHPRTLLADLDGTKAQETYRKEIAWREFYADVLWHEPHTAREYYKPNFARMRYDAPDERFTAWCEGRTGYPFVDAGMRQLLAEGWMHNRLRMVVASFLIKDLHIEWQHGARHFMKWLRDGDVASNSHGWQWTAGCGTDAAPYFRIFNPIEQGRKFDPNGDYIRKYVPELRHLDATQIHEPWLFLDGLGQGYPQRIVDHAIERQEALARLAEIAASSEVTASGS
jgi:deoxyribodipyrimidine photo-lyase